jgi:DNA mismatch repair protein MutS2
MAGLFLWIEMDRKHWETLELPAILGRLAEYASFSAGRELALALTPSSDLEEVRYRQAETEEARRLLDVKPDLRLGGVHDLRSLVDNALRGARLLPQDLLNIRDTLARVETLRRSLLRLKAEYPHFAAIAWELVPCPEIVAEVERCISDHGEVLDRASSALARIRAALKVAYDRLMEKLNRIVAGSQSSRYLQEAYVTQRDGRYVIPVKSDFKGRIPGLVHDRSASGATVFIEPLATVELNNQWRELQLDEEREVERILLALSSRVADEAEAIRVNVETLARMDLVLARAKYAYSMRAVKPEVVPWVDRRGKTSGQRARHPGSTIDLRQARHPLLDPKTVVPIDVCMDEDEFIVVITGPNTGGKTVSLKTVGLLALMAQCGLHLPTAEGSRLSVFEHICADIGDEQSIEQSLSTFSSHMTRIIGILDLADDRSLVLLDEIGAGTDPVEGAALAQSLLIHLSQRRTTTLATTHYPELKVFAERQPGVVNASVEFDLETLSPTYQLTVGLPGHSNAFAIARRLSLPEPIVQRAEGLVSTGHREAEQFLAQIKETQAQTAQAQAEAEAARREAQQLAEELRVRLADIQSEREAILSAAREQAAESLQDVRREMRSIRRRLAVVAGTSSDLAEIESTVDALDERLAPADTFALEPPEASELLGHPVDVGDTVWVPGLNTTGEVLALDGQAAEVQVGSFRVRTRREPLELRQKAAAQAEQEPKTTVTMPPAPATSVELHLRGLRAQDAVQRLEKYLDDAYRAHVPFARVVHGKGKGVLRQAVREHLRSHPLVDSYRDGAEGEGDTGVTVVKFVDR